MTKFTLKANPRKILGRKVKKLRLEGSLPANIYGKDIKSQAVSVEVKEFTNVYHQAGETGIIDLMLAKEKKPRPVLVHNLQKNPVTDNLLHVDFRQIDLKQKVQVAIPLEFIGQSPAVTKGGVLAPVMTEIRIEALPADLPDKFSVDISKIIEIGQSLSIKDLKVDKSKVKLLVDDDAQLIIKVEAPKKEEEEVKPAVEAVPAEGEAAAAAKPGEAKPAETGKTVKPAEAGKEAKPQAANS